MDILAARRRGEVIHSYLRGVWRYVSSWLSVKRILVVMILVIFGGHGLSTWRRTGAFNKNGNKNADLVAEIKQKDEVFEQDGGNQLVHLSLGGSSETELSNVEIAHSMNGKETDAYEAQKRGQGEINEEQSATDTWQHISRKEGEHNREHHVKRTPESLNEVAPGKEGQRHVEKESATSNQSEHDTESLDGKETDANETRKGGQGEINEEQSVTDTWQQISRKEGEHNREHHVKSTLESLTEVVPGNEGQRHMEKGSATSNQSEHDTENLNSALERVSGRLVQPKEDQSNVAVQTREVDNRRSENTSGEVDDRSGTTNIKKENSIFHSDTEPDTLGSSLAGKGLYKNRKGDMFLCDRTDFFSDVCFMQGDVRVVGKTKTVVMFANHPSTTFREERIKPYTQKWQKSLPPIQELLLLHIGLSAKAPKYERRKLLVEEPLLGFTDDRQDFLESLPGKFKTSFSKHNLARRNPQKLTCEMTHNVPGVIFSAGGWAGGGNYFHSFNDVIIPLYITVQHFQGTVVLVIVEAKNWWLEKFSPLLASLSHYPIINLRKDKRRHCFPLVIAGLRRHGGMRINPEFMPGGENEATFQEFLQRSFKSPSLNPHPDVPLEWWSHQKVIRPSSQGPWEDQPVSHTCLSEINVVSFKLHWPLLLIMSRKGCSRSWKNEGQFAKMAASFGFWVYILRTNRNSALREVYELLQIADIVVGVHGAGLTNLVFMRPASLLIQLSPIGTLWLAQSCFGDPAVHFNLKYLELPLSPSESSLSSLYRPSDPILTSPQLIANNDWSLAQELYMRGQNVTVSKESMMNVIEKAKHHIMDTVLTRKKTSC